jgi:hypothetical protein
MRIWNATKFSINRDRLLQGEIAEPVFAEVLAVDSKQRLVL